KILGQIGLGLIVALTLYLSDDVVVRVNVAPPAGVTVASADAAYDDPAVTAENRTVVLQQQSTAVNVKSTKTTIPSVKSKGSDSAGRVPLARGETEPRLGWLGFMAVVGCVGVGVSSGVNLADGLAGLTAGTRAVAGVTLGILAYVSGNIIYANERNIMS